MDKKELEVDEANKLVVETSREIQKLILDKLYTIDEHQRFLIHGRIVNCVFNSFYKPMLNGFPLKTNESLVKGGGNG